MHTSTRRPLGLRTFSGSSGRQQRLHLGEEKRPVSSQPRGARA